MSCGIQDAEGVLQSLPHNAPEYKQSPCVLNDPDCVVILHPRRMFSSDFALPIMVNIGVTHIVFLLIL